MGNRIARYKGALLEAISRRPILVCCGAIALLAAAQLLFLLHLTLSSRNEVAIGERRTLVSQLALDLERSFDATEAKQILKRFRREHAMAEPYIVDKFGVIQAGWMEEGHLKLPFLDTKPIHKFMAQAEPSGLLGDDPRHYGVRRAFAAATIELGGKPGYLYVVFGSPSAVSLATLVSDMDTVKGVIIATLCTVLTACAAIFALWFSLMIKIRRMSETMANVSHDLRTPIASIQGYLETILMKESNMNADERRQFLAIALRNTHALGSLVGDLLELSKLDGKAPPREQFSLYELVGDILMKFAPQASAKSIELAATGDPILPMAYANIGMIERVISNLIENALRHTPNGGKISLFLRANDDSISFKIMDTGCGIPPEKVGTIFQRFFTTESGKETGALKSGSGLGLSITQKIIEAHEGSIKVKSKVNEGTIIEFNLPLAPHDATIH